MQHHPIEKAMKRLHADVEVLLNEQIERWQVYQINVGSLYMLNGARNRGRKLLWTIETEDSCPEVVAL